MKNKWEIIHESDTDSGKPTSWALEINHEKYGKYVWITGVLDYDEETIIQYEVEICYGNKGNDFRTLKVCKSLASAKRWVSMNLM